MMALRIAAGMGATTATRFAVLTHDLGKALTPSREMAEPSRARTAGYPGGRGAIERLRVPKDYRESRRDRVGLPHTRASRAPAETFDDARALREDRRIRRPDRFNEFVTACECDARGRLGLEAREYPQAERLRQARSVAAAVTLTEADRQGLSGTAIGEETSREETRVPCFRLTPRRPRAASPL